MGTGKVGQIRCALFGEVGFGELCFGVAVGVRLGEVRCGKVGSVMVSFGSLGAVRYGPVR